MEKWLQSDPNRSPENHKKSMKIGVGTFKGPPECTIAPNDHQNGAKVVLQDLKMPQKWRPRTIISTKLNADLSETNSKSFDQWMQLCLKNINSWNYVDCKQFKSACCQGGRRQGRSLEIISNCQPSIIYIIIYIYIYII